VEDTFTLGTMHWIIAKVLAEKYGNRDLAFLATWGDILAYKLAKRGFVVDGITFKYRRTITITEQSGSNWTDYPVLIELDSTNFDFTHTQTNGKDVRFTNANENLLYFWIERWDTLTKKARVWVNVPSIIANSSIEIYMYYGNDSCPSASNGENTFDLFDHFDSLDTNKWEVHKKGSANAIVSVADSLLHLAGEQNVISSGNVKSLATFTKGFAIRLKHKIDDEHYADVSIGSGELQGADDGVDDWWHTVLGDGYSFVWQSPVSGDSSADVRLISCPQGSGGSNLDTLDAGDLTRLNEFLTEEVRYTKDGGLEFLIANNVRVKLNTPTYDGSGEAVHPDVVYFKNGWNGYKYWMAMTPYPNSNSDYENPSILVSQDGHHWIEPPGITNPIEPAPATGHNSDPDLIYNDDADELWLYFRHTNTLDTIYLKKSSDGIVWSDKIQVLQGTFNSLISPAVIKEGNKFYMWTVDETSSPYQLKLYESDDGESFSLSDTCVLDYTPPDKDIWHLDVIKVGNEYWALFTFCDAGTSGGNARDYFAKSTNKINWNVQQTILIDARSGFWDSYLIYRGSLLYFDPRLRIWYSASGGTGWHIGYTEAEYVDGNWTLVEAEVLNVLLKATDTTYLNDNKNILLSQGEYSGGQGGNRYIDWILVRKYASPEPSVSIGSEKRA